MKMLRHVHNAIIFIALLLFSTDVVQAEIYKHVGKDGEITITDNVSNIPEEQRGQVSAYKEEPRTAGTASPAPAGAPSRPYVYLSDQDKCYLRIFGKGFGASDLTDYRAIGLTRDKFDQLKMTMQEKYALTDATVCAVLTPDPRFSSPESTWTRYKEALLRGSMDEAMECFSFESVKRFREVFDALGKEKMKQIAADMQPIQKVKQDDDSAKYRIRKNEQGREITYYIYFDNVYGNWKIRQF